MRVILLLFALLAASGGARAETVASCKGFVTALPATIAEGGTWCFDRDLSTSVASGNAITIGANNVTLDCNGFKLGGLGAGPTTATNGILSQDRLNTVVRDCNLRGFRFGIVAIGGGGHLVERNRVERSTLVGIFASGTSGVIRDNQVVETAAAGTVGIGIGAGGAVDVLDNVVADVATAGVDGRSYGISLNGAEGKLVERNIVRGLRTNAGIVYGIYIASNANRIFVRDNDVMSVTTETIGTGIFCQAGESYSLLQGNSLLNFPSPWSGCVDGGRNHEVLP